MSRGSALSMIARSHRRGAAVGVGHHDPRRVPGARQRHVPELVLVVTAAAGFDRDGAVVRHIDVHGTADAAAPRRRGAPWVAGSPLAAGAPRLSRRRPPASAGRARRSGRRRRRRPLRPSTTPDRRSRRPRPSAVRRVPRPMPGPSPSQTYLAVVRSVPMLAPKKIFVSFVIRVDSTSGSPSCGRLWSASGSDNAALDWHRLIRALVRSLPLQASAPVFRGGAW